MPLPSEHPLGATPAKAPSPLVLERVSFSYRKAPVLKEASLEISPGMLFILIGDNGAGKSTIARLATGELAPASGTVRLFGEDPRRFRHWEKAASVSQLSGSVNVHFPANVFELVDASQRPCRGCSRRERRGRTVLALAQVGMQDFGRRRIDELSGGQLQRVRLACALAKDPEFLILDEPTAGLDEESRKSFFRLLDEAYASRRLAVLLVTHDAAQARRRDVVVARLSAGAVETISSPSCS